MTDGQDERPPHSWLALTGLCVLGLAAMAYDVVRDRPLVSLGAAVAVGWWVA